MAHGFNVPVEAKAEGCAALWPKPKEAQKQTCGQLPGRSFIGFWAWKGDSSSVEAFEAFESLLGQEEPAKQAGTVARAPGGVAKLFVAWAGDCRAVLLRGRRSDLSLGRGAVEIGSRDPSRSRRGAFEAMETPARGRRPGRFSLEETPGKVVRQKLETLDTEKDKESTQVTLAKWKDMHGNACFGVGAGSCSF